MLSRQSRPLTRSVFMGIVLGFATSYSPCHGRCPESLVAGIADDEGSSSDSEAADAFERDPSRSNTKRALRILDEKVNDWESHTTRVVATILTTIGDHRIEAGRRSLVKFLRADPGKSGGDLLATCSAISLGQLGGAQSLEALADAAAQPSAPALSSVAVGLGLLNDRRAVPVLENILWIGDVPAKARALSALAQYCAGSSRKIAVDSLSDQEPRIRVSATWWLGSCGTEEDSNRLANLLEDREALVRSNALKGLLRLQSQAGCDHIEILLKDDNITVSELARKYQVICEPVHK
jgi:HEAT repeat protein